MPPRPPPARVIALSSATLASPRGPLSHRHLKAHMRSVHASSTRRYVCGHPGCLQPFANWDPLCQPCPPTAGWVGGQAGGDSGRAGGICDLECRCIRDVMQGHSRPQTVFIYIEPWLSCEGLASSCMALCPCRFPSAAALRLHVRSVQHVVRCVLCALCARACVVRCQNMCVRDAAA